MFHTDTDTETYYKCMFQLIPDHVFKPATSKFVRARNSESPVGLFSSLLCGGWLFSSWHEINFPASIHLDQASSLPYPPPPPISLPPIKILPIPRLLGVQVGGKSSLLQAFWDLLSTWSVGPTESRFSDRSEEKKNKKQLYFLKGVKFHP